MRGWGRLVAGFVLAFAVVAIGSAGIASGAQVTNPASSECNPDGRAFCIDVTTWDGITASDPARPGGTRYTWVEWEMSNAGGSTLTNPAVVVSLKDFDCSAQVPPPPGQDPLTGCTALSQTSAIQGTTVPSGCTVSGSTLTCTYASIPAGGDTGVRRVYFKTGNEPTTHTRITVRGTVKERGNDAGSGAGGCAPADPNCDTFETFVDNSYEPLPNAAFTFALNGSKFYLETDDQLGTASLGASSFTFTSGSAAIFRTEFRADPSVCGTPSPTCFQRTLSVQAVDASPGNYNSGPLVFYARLTNVPSGVTDRSVVATHTYDDSTSQVIGDQDTERTKTAGCTFTYSTQIPLPSICAQKVKGVAQALDVWVWDTTNGVIKFG
jgi:hypothetical protein